MNPKKPPALISERGRPGLLVHLGPGQGNRNGNRGPGHRGKRLFDYITDQQLTRRIAERQYELPPKHEKWTVVDLGGGRLVSIGCSLDDARLAEDLSDHLIRIASEKKRA